jgi:hypothetical protein
MRTCRPTLGVQHAGPARRRRTSVLCRRVAVREQPAASARGRSEGGGGEAGKRCLGLPSGCRFRRGRNACAAPAAGSARAGARAAPHLRASSQRPVCGTRRGRGEVVFWVFREGASSPLLGWLCPNKEFPQEAQHVCTYLYLWGRRPLETPRAGQPAGGITRNNERRLDGAHQLWEVSRNQVHASKSPLACFGAAARRVCPDSNQLPAPRSWLVRSCPLFFFVAPRAGGARVQKWC